MFEKIKTDIERFCQVRKGSGPTTFAEKLDEVLMNPCLHVLMLYRFLNWVVNEIHNPVVRRFFTLSVRPLVFWYRRIHGISIDNEASIGKGFYIGHPGGILIGPVKIGENCNIAHNVTIGLGGRGEGRELPEIGCQVWIGTMSVIFGKIVIGDHTTILPGTILSKSVPPHVTVGGNPGRIIMQNTNNDDIIFGTGRYPAGR